MKQMKVTRGQVVWVELKGEGSVQSGRRPMVVISNNRANTFSPVILCTPLTTQSKKKIPTHVSVPSDCENGLKRDCTLMTEQLFTVDKESILSTVGRVSEGIMSQINEALKVSLAL